MGAAGEYDSDLQAYALLRSCILVLPFRFVGFMGYRCGFGWLRVASRTRGGFRASGVLTCSLRDIVLSQDVEPSAIAASFQA